MKVLITGAGGFIGSHLVDSQLDQGHDVRAVDLQVDRLEQAQKHPNLEIVQGDLTDEVLVSRLVKEIDIIYHLASAHLDITLPDSYYRQVNVTATSTLLQAAWEAGVGRMIHCSTNSVIGEIKNPPVDETADCNPTNIYEETKLEGERVVLDFYKKTGFPVVIVRPAWVYGPRCPRTNRLMRMVGKGRFLMFGDGQTLRHPIFIRDMVEALELIAGTDEANGEIYFIAGDKPVTIENLVQSIADVQDVQLRIIHLPLLLGKTAGYGIEYAFKPLGKQPPFSQRSLDFFIKDNAYDISKARRELGFAPKVNLESGLRHTWQQLNTTL